MVCARLPGAEEEPGCLLGCHDGLDCVRRYNRCAALCEFFVVPLALANACLPSEVTGSAFS